MQKYAFLLKRSLECEENMLNFLKVIFLFSVIYNCLSYVRILSHFIDISIIVTEGLTKNRKAAVKKLDGAHLSILVNQTDVSLDKLHNINDNHLHEKDNKENIKMVLVRNSIINITNDNSIIISYRRKFFYIIFFFFLLFATYHFYIKFMHRIIRIILVLLLIISV